jgi:lipopolysaccharide transport system permease protein
MPLCAAAGIPFGELWRYRDLVRAFVVRDLHVRFRQTALGAAWILVQPIGHTLVFSGFFQLLGSTPATTDVPYPILLLSGAIIWQTFVQSVQQSTMCLTNNRQLVTKTYFPRLLLPIAAVMTPLIDFGIGWSCLLVASLAFGVTPSVWWLLTPFAAVLVWLVSFTVGVWVSMLNALYRDVTSLVPFALQMGFFLTPVIFQTSVLIPERYRALVGLNPLATVIELFRAGWLQQPLPSLATIAISVAVTVTFLFSGLWYFARTEDIVADRV